MASRSAVERPASAGSALLTWGTNVGSAILALGSILIVARELGPEGRGHVALLTAIALLLGNLATAGVQEANANFAAQEPSTRPALATNSLLLAVALGAIAAGALAVLLWAVPDAVGEDTSRRFLWATVAFVPLIILEIYLLYLAQADYAFVVTNASMLLAPAVAFTGNAAFALTGALTVRNAVAVWLAGQVAATTLLVWFVGRRLGGFGRPDLGLARRSLGFGLRAYVGRVMQLGNYRLDQWLLGAISGARALGLYSVAVAWAEALWYLPTALAAVQRPDLVRSDPRTAGERAARVFRGSILVTAISGILMIALAPFLCTVVFGEPFRDSVGQLRVLVLGAFGIVAVKLLGNALVARGRPGLQSAAVGIGFLGTVVLDVLLIPPYAGMGAAIASSAAYTAAGATMAVIFVRLLGPRYRDLVPRRSDVSWVVGQLQTIARRQRVAPADVIDTPKSA
ncbi:MAG TPA: oligosaccharide flippase family protein [Gaiellaceae bacterium]|nr:oligosaccharide flippase family protein [Gaiellaceae bacterium]